eukprot:3675079-Amphidinium_carterae.1
MEREKFNHQQKITTRMRFAEHQMNEKFASTAGNFTTRAEHMQNQVQSLTNELKLAHERNQQ